MRLTRPTVGIVGGIGRMGSWLAGLLESQGLKVLRASRSTDLTPQEMAGQSHVVVISVPIADTIKVIQEVGPFVPEHGLFMDLTSLKKAPLEAMLSYSSAEVVGAHPLFGPGDKPTRRHTVAICPGRGETGMKWLAGVLKKAGIKVLVMDPEEHDRKMGLIQGVNHFSTLALALCISQSGFAFEDIANCSTHTFRRRLDRIRSIMRQTPELFESLLMDNPRASECIERYRESVEGLIRITRDGDRKAFGELFESLRKVFNNNLHDPCVSTKDENKP